MGEDTNQIERDIRDTRNALGRDLDRLGDKAHELVSWRSHYESNSRLFLGAAFGAGLVLGLAALRSNQNGSEYDTDTDTDVDELNLIGGETYAVGLPRTGNGHTNGNGTMARVKHEFGETWSAIADGLVRAASAKAVQFLSDRVPGFGDQIEGRYAPDRQRTWSDPIPSGAPSSDLRARHDERE